MLTEFYYLFIRTKIVEFRWLFCVSDLRDDCLVGFFPSVGYRFTSLFVRGFSPFFVVCGLAVVCSRREMCVVVTVVFGSRRLVLSPGRWGGCAP